MDIRVQDAAFDLGAEVNGFAARQTGMGAVVSFTGIVRDIAPGLEAMQIEHYPGMTEKALAGIAEEAQRRWSLGDVLVIHRFGALQPDEMIMMVATSSPHRADAFQAAEFLKRNDDAKWRSSLTKPDGLIQKVDSLFENTSRPFKKEEIDVIRKACSVPPQQWDDEVLQHLAYVLNFITFFKQLPQQAVFDLCRDINYIAVKGNPIELFKQGSLGNSVYLILSGKCTVYRAAANQP